MKAEAMVTIGGELRIVDRDDDDAPLIICQFQNEYGGRFASLSDKSKLMLGEAIAAVTSQTFKNHR